MKLASKYSIPSVLPERAIHLTAICVVSAALTACGGSSGGGTMDGGSDTQPLITDTELDTDLDGISDLDEIALGTDPDVFDSDLDSDGDGVSNLEEIQNGTDPAVADSVVVDPDPDTDPDTTTSSCADTNSSNPDWSDNCLLSQSSEFATSSYTQGVQRILVCQGAAGEFVDINDYADGIFGPNTELAVRAYQTANNLLVDGIVGPETWGSLFDELNIIAGDDLIVDGTAYVPNAVDGCDAQAAMFYQEAEGVDLLGWKMALTPGSSTPVDFSTGAPN